MHPHTPDLSPSVADLKTATVTIPDSRRGFSLALKNVASEVEGTQRKSYLFLLTCYRVLALWQSMDKLNILISSPENASENSYVKWEVEEWLIPLVVSK